MRAVVTRVSRAGVAVGGEEVSRIGQGLLVLLAAEIGDGKKDIDYIVDKVLHLRIFGDGQGKMNRSVLDAGGELLLVSQFTLMGDARKGRRPSYIRAGAPQTARELYDAAVAAFLETGISCKTGVFQADMQVESINDGPVTILLDSRKLF